MGVVISANGTEPTPTRLIMVLVSDSPPRALASASRATAPF
ncbi:hypothetical protein [Spiractinospora alimapuensis]|nr:hypothetical protein [Spiractinospora alimapuensis]